MKGRESGMPEEVYWQTFYDADCIVEKLECTKARNESIAEFGSGYGTFTFPAAKRTSGVVHAFDIEPELVTLVQRKAQEYGLPNVRAKVRDFIAQGTGLPDRSVDHAMVYNLLHIEAPVRLLKEAYRILKPGGAISIIHWKFDPTTPRGPSMNIRPRPEQCRAWAEAAGFVFSATKIYLSAANIIMVCSSSVLMNKHPQPNQTLGPTRVVDFNVRQN